MKSKKKMIALLLAAIMVIGMPMTAFAQNASPYVPELTEDEKAQYFSESVYANARIVAGQGTIAKVTDKKALASGFDLRNKFYYFGGEGSLSFLYGACDFDKLMSNTNTPRVTCQTLVDVQGVTSGEVTVQLFDQGYTKVDGIQGTLAVVYHYNATSDKWERMNSVALIDDNCRLTFSFDSYSPVFIYTTGVKAEWLKKDADISITKVNMDPKQVVETKTVEEKVTEISSKVQANAKVAAGSGTVAPITDKEVLAKVYDQSAKVESFVNATLTTKLEDEAKEVEVKGETLIDVQGVSSGEVTVQLQDQGDYKVSDMKGHLAIVSHLNMTTGEWEQMKDLALIDENGCVTFSFNSYSPIMISVTNLTPADFKKDAGVTVKQATMTPQQVKSQGTDAPNGTIEPTQSGNTTEPAKVKAPKMGE